MSNRHPDYSIIFLVALLTIFGLAILASASSNLGKINFEDTYYYLKHQIVYGLIPGIIGFIIGAKIYYYRWEKIAIFLLVLSIVLLVLVYTPVGIEVGGATRWLKLGPISFQPAETLKLTLVFYLAAWLGKNSERTKSFKAGFLPFIVVSAVIAGLLLKQPATSATVILLSVALIIYFVSGARLSYLLGAIILGIIALSLLIYLTPYRFERVSSYLMRDHDILKSGYHLNQSLIAIGSGGLFGVGYGQSTTKIHYLPEPIGDSIFAVIAEEFGFIGSISLLCVFILLIFKILFLIRKTENKFAQLLLTGFGSLLAIQTFINIAAISGLIPLTGTPLPFISYGGTALTVFLTISGIIVNISKHTRR
jgi:cell division protein FtsW